MSFDPISYLLGTKTGGGGGGSVIVEPLSVTENGEYAEPGKAFSPVTVNVVENRWIRPSGWPDLDSITMNPNTDIDEVYLTYDLSKTAGYGWIGIRATTMDKSDFTVERGHLSGSTFVADETHTVTVNGYGTGYFRQALDDADGAIQLWRVVGYKFSAFGFVANTANSADNLANNLQPCVETGGRLGYRTSMDADISTTATTLCNGTVYLERYGIKVNTSAVISMGKMFSGCRSLVEADVSDWNTGSVTSMLSAFSGCLSLKFFDVSDWDVSSVTNMSYMLSDCNSLTELDLSGWDTTALTNASSMFAGSKGLKAVDISGWDTTAITTMKEAFLSCMALQTLNADGVDLSGLASNVPVLSPTMMLREYYPFIISIDQNFQNNTCLSVASLLRIIDSLPAVESTKTLTLGTNKLKLTADQIAVATAKGWTVA